MGSLIRFLCWLELIHSGQSDHIRDVQGFFFMGADWKCRACGRTYWKRYRNPRPFGG